MVIYSIKDLENLTGIKAHTLRIWEKRYRIIDPKRTETNIRYYDDDNLKKIMNVALLNRKGYKISRIAEMTSGEMQSLAAELSDVDKSFESQLDALTYSVLELNEQKFFKIFDTHIHQNGFKQAMTTVIHPLLDKIGIMWMTGSVEPVHERFVTNLIKRKCLAEIDKLKANKSSDDLAFLLFLSEGETGELSLLFMHYLISCHGYRVINLGSEVDISLVASACRICHPNFVLTILDSSMSSTNYSNYLEALSALSYRSTFIVTGLQVFKQTINYPKNVKAIKSLQEITDFLNSTNVSPIHNPAQLVP